MGRPAIAAAAERGGARLTIGLLGLTWATVNTQRLTAAAFIGASTIMADFGITAGPAGLLVAAYFPVYGLMQLPAGLLVDRLPPRRILLVAVGLVAASNLLFALAPSVEWAIVARAAVGFSSAPVWLSCLKILAHLSLQQYPRRLGLLVTAGSFGTLTGLSLLPLLLALWPWRQAALALAAPLLLLAVVLALTRLPSPATSGARRPPGSPLAQLGPWLRSASFWWLALPAIAWNGAYFGVLAWLPRFARDVLQADPALVGLLPGLSPLGLLLGGVLIGSLHTRWRAGGPSLFFGGGLLSGLLLASLPMLAGLAGGWPAYAVVAMVGFLFGAFFVWMSLVSQLIPNTQLGAVTGLLNGLTFLSAFLDPWLVGLLLDYVDRPLVANPTYSAAAYGVAFATLAATLLIGLAGGALCGRARRGSAPLETR